LSHTDSGCSETLYSTNQIRWQERKSGFSEEPTFKCTCENNKGPDFVRDWGMAWDENYGIGIRCKSKFYIKLFCVRNWSYHRQAYCTSN
jgi:hypothetical protein